MRKTILLGAILGLVMGTVSIVEANDDKWRIRGFYVQTWPSTDSYQTESVLGDSPLLYNELSLDKGEGFELDIGYMLNPKLELMLTGIFTDMEGTFVAGIEPGEASDRFIDNNTVDFYTINLGANYHFTPESRVDFYLGAFVGVFSYDSVRFNLPEIDEQVKINFDDQFSYGFTGGIDIPFTQDGPLFFALAVKYLLSDLKEDGGPREIAIDPIIGSIGIGCRF